MAIMKLANSISPLLRPVKRCKSQYLQNYHKVNWFVPRELEEVEWVSTRRKLKMLPKQPTSFYGSKMPYYTKRTDYLRGPEQVQNRLIYQQYGMQALAADYLRFEHFEIIRGHVNRKMDDKRMFAEWRIDAPWKPHTKRSVGRTLGGGKGDIRYYTTPVKANRMMLELGGHLTWYEAYSIIKGLIHMIPCTARFVSQEMIELEDKMECYIKESNVNVFDLEFAMKHNLYGCKRFLSPYYVDWKTAEYK